MIFILAFMLTGCSDKNEEKQTLTIADQFGLAYAPIEIMKVKPFLQDRLAAHGLENIEVQYERMGNTTAIREAMLANELDIGFMAIPPFLLGIENGMDWKIISAVSESPVGLVGKNTQDLDSISEDKKIILPQIGSVQHILLAMAAEDNYGDWSKYNEQIIAMSHPDGLTTITADPDSYYHFTTPPFLEMELENDELSEVINGQEIFNEPFTFIISVCPKRVYQDEALYTAFQEALALSIDFINENPEESKAILVAAYEYSEDLVNEVLDNPQMIYTTDVKGVGKFQDYMIKMDLLKNRLDVGQVFWDVN